jgi:hypothetical protein
VNGALLAPIFGVKISLTTKNFSPEAATPRFYQTLRRKRIGKVARPEANLLFMTTKPKIADDIGRGGAVPAEAQSDVTRIE